MFVKTFQADFGPAYKTLSQQRTLLSPVTIEAFKLMKSPIKMINGALFSHVYFATPPIPRSWEYLDSLGKFGFWA